MDIDRQYQSFVDVRKYTIGHDSVFLFRPAYIQHLDEDALPLLLVELRLKACLQLLRGVDLFSAIDYARHPFATKPEYEVNAMPVGAGGDGVLVDELAP